MSKPNPSVVALGAFIPLHQIKARVHIDNDASITAVVLGYLVRAQGDQYEVAWFNNGSHHTAWVDGFRLSRAELT